MLSRIERDISIPLSTDSFKDLFGMSSVTYMDNIQQEIKDIGEGLETNSFER